MEKQAGTMSMASRPPHGFCRASRVPPNLDSAPQGLQGLQAPGIHRALTSRWHAAVSL